MKLARTVTIVARAALPFVLAGNVAAQVLFVDVDAPAGGDGSSWTTAYSDLQDAIARSELDPQVRELWIADGTYVPGSAATDTFRMTDGVAWYGGFVGSETALAERDPAANVTVLSGDVLGNDVVQDADGDGILDYLGYDDNVLHVVTADAVGPAAILDGLKIRGGHAADPSFAFGDVGGGVLVRSGAPSLVGLDVRESFAAFSGGGIYAEPSLGVLSLASSTIRRNRSVIGGGVSVIGGDADVDASTFARNYATSGGGIWIREGTLTVEGALFVNCRATSGAGIATYEATLAVEDSEFRKSKASSGAGINTLGTDATVRSCVFEDLDATTGAGLFLYQGMFGAKTTTVEDSTFTNNSATSGAGAFVGVHNLPPFSQSFFLSCEFRHNDIEDGGGAGGGAIAVDGTSLSSFQPEAATLFQCVMFDNERSHVKVDSLGVARLVNCTLANDGSPYPGIDVVSGRVDLENSVVWDGKSNLNQVQPSKAVARYSNVWMKTNPLSGPGNLSKNPRFVDLGGGDLRLSKASPCVDAGDPSFATIGTDASGDPRRVDGDLDGVVSIDIGASEYTPLRLAIAGALATGEILTFDTTGEPGLATLMTAGRYSESVALVGLGTYLLDPSQSPFSVIPWFDTPSSFQVQLPPGLPAGEALTFVQVGFGSSGMASSNAVTLQF